MGKVVEKKKKKKGRPSLLDLQKRTIKEQQQQQLQQQKRNVSAPHSSNNYKTTTAAPVRRSTRRNPSPSTEDREDDEELAGNRKEKKLKLVLKLPSQKSPINSAVSLNSADSNAEEDGNSASNQRKRKINAIGDGSGAGDGEKEENSVSGTNNTQGTQLDLGPSTPLPDKKLLLFILDRLQKKDTYGVFSDPVDPNELPDYFEVIEHPMDFGTVRKNLASGAYANLEQFERDVFLICSNAMQYNSPDTIYFRQARSIEELAKKNFENLRQDSDDNEPEAKVVRRGRPPTKNFKKSLGRPSLERAGSEFSSDATLATGAENSIWSNHDQRKGHLPLDKIGFSDSSGRFNGSRNAYGSWLAENKFEKSDEGSMLKGYSMKHGRRHFVLDENRRNTYKQFHPLAGGREPSVFTTFGGEMKQLMAVGLHTEYGYARSLARFAANLGPVAWKIAVRKIEKCLPGGVKFGPGWVGENDLPPQRPLLSSLSPAHASSSQKFSVPETSYSAASPRALESKGDKLLEKPEGVNSSENHVSSVHSAMDGHLSKPLTPSATSNTLSSVFPASTSREPRTEKVETAEGFNSHSGFNIVNSNLGVIRPRPPFQIHPGMNGFNGTYGFNLSAQMGKLMGATRPAGFSFQSSQVVDAASRTNNNFVHPVTKNNIHSEDSMLFENASMMSSSNPLPNSGCEALAAPKSGLHPQPSWQRLSPQRKPDSRLTPQQKPDLAPPDLNVRFQSPGSPSSGRVDSTQPDLALQL